MASDYGITDWWNNGLGAFFTDSARNLGNLAGTIGNWLTSRPDYPKGKGPGDQMFGPAPERVGAGNGSGTRIGAGGYFGPSPADIISQGLSSLQNTPLPSYQDALSQAASMLNQMGYDPGYVDVNSISWDPLRQDAKSREADYDAKIAAMYNALTNNVRTKDASDIKQNFADALSSVKDSAQRAATGTTQAAQAAQANNIDVLKRLGQEEAAARIIEQGRDLNTAAAQQVGTINQRGQAAEDAVARKQQASLDYNTGMAGAYGLQGANARDALKQQLASLLANYDMQEQQARASAQAQNASRASQAQSVLMSLANNVLGNDWNTIKYNDSLSQQKLQAAQQQAAAQQAAQQQAANQQAAMQWLLQLTNPQDKGGMGLSVDDAAKYSNIYNSYFKTLK